MRIISFYPGKSFFLPGTKADFVLEIESKGEQEIIVEFEIINLQQVVFSDQISQIISAGKNKIPLSWAPLPNSYSGYGARIQISDSQSGKKIASESTAFDVLSKWTDFPRYGFLSDFQEGRDDPALSLKTLLQFHINGIQFYDWQYRHDNLVPPKDIYIDPLGRKLSLRAVKNCIKSAHEYGMSAMAYLAIYSASLEFWKKHKTWGMFDSGGNPYKFEDFLGLMDPSTDSHWITHLLNRCDDVTSRLGFDGYHVDQYGEPRIAYDLNGEKIDLPEAFVAFINKLKNQFPNSKVVFNAVKNWPINALASSKQDFNYIEIWPDTPTYAEIADIVINARQRSLNKPVVIAQYLHANEIEKIRMSNSIIMASGGTRIEIGEQGRLLADPYFPKHESVSPELKEILRRMSDFVVRYSELIGPGADNVSFMINNVPDEVKVICRKTDKYLVINLINMQGIKGKLWTVKHAAPIKLKDFSIEIDNLLRVQNAWWASPDGKNLDLIPCRLKTTDQNISIKIPSLFYWSMIVIQSENKKD